MEPTLSLPPTTRLWLKSPPCRLSVLTLLCRINERRKITHQVYQWLGISSQGQPDVDVVMDIIAKYADIREKDSLYGELTAHFYETQFPDAPEDIKLHLTDMIWPEIISLDLEAATALRRRSAKL